MSNPTTRLQHQWILTLQCAVQSTRQTSLVRYLASCYTWSSRHPVFGASEERCFFVRWAQAGGQPETTAALLEPAFSDVEALVAGEVYSNLGGKRLVRSALAMPRRARWQQRAGTPHLTRIRAVNLVLRICATSCRVCNFLRYPSLGARHADVVHACPPRGRGCRRANFQLGFFGGGRSARQI